MREYPDFCTCFIFADFTVYSFIYLYILALMFRIKSVHIGAAVVIQLSAGGCSLVGLENFFLLVSLVCLTLWQVKCPRWSRTDQFKWRNRDHSPDLFFLHFHLCSTISQYESSFILLIFFSYFSLVTHLFSITWNHLFWSIVQICRFEPRPASGDVHFVFFPRPLKDSCTCSFLCQVSRLKLIISFFLGVFLSVNPSCDPAGQISLSCIKDKASPISQPHSPLTPNWTTESHGLSRHKDLSSSTNTFRFGWNLYQAVFTSFKHYSIVFKHRYWCRGESVSQAKRCVLKGGWVGLSLSLSHRMGWSLSGAAKSSHGAQSEQWTRANPSNVLRPVRLCRAAALSSPAFHSGRGPSQAAKPHRCAQPRRSKPHSRARPAAADVTALLPRLSRRRDDERGALEPALRLLVLLHSCLMAKLASSRTAGPSKPCESELKNTSC